MRLGMFALIRPVTTSTDGRCVATTRCMPAARAICARRQIASSTSFGAAAIIRSEMLVDDDDDLRHLVHRLAVFILVAVRLGEGVVALEVAHVVLRKDLVALEHLRDGPVQCAGCLARIGHDRDEQVRDAVVDAELDDLRVDHQKAHVVRAGLVQQADDQRVECRPTCPSRSCRQSARAAFWQGPRP